MSAPIHALKDHSMIQHRGPEYERIQQVCRCLEEARTKGELATLLVREISQYSLFDLQVIMGRIRHEIHRLPSTYRKSAGPFLLSQIVDSHHSLLTMYTRGDFQAMTRPIPTRDVYLSFVAMIPEGCYAGDIRDVYLPQFHSPMHRLFYYLLSAFDMFVLEQPGHPVGTPFPGGMRVEERDGIFICPVRDKEKEVFFSICNFCPAHQREGV